MIKFITRYSWHPSDWFVLWSVLLLAVGVGSAHLWNEVTTDHRAPLVDLRIEAKSPVFEGQVLQLKAIRTKLREDCIPVISLRSAVNNQTGELYTIPFRVWVGGRTDESFVNLVFDVSKLPPGTYTGRLQSFYPCPGVDQPFEYDNSFEFEILPKERK